MAHPPLLREAASRPAPHPRWQIMAGKLLATTVFAFVSLCLALLTFAYAMPLILLVLTVSLAVFIASLAYTLDLQLIDDARYATGADVNLRGPGLPQ